MISQICPPFVRHSRTCLNSEERRRLVHEAGQIHEVTNHDTTVYMGLAGISLGDAEKIVKLTSTRSCLPEPLRVAHLIASGSHRILGK